MRKVKPITPKAVFKAQKKEDSFPPEIIEAFNELIIKNFKNGEARVLQDEVCKLACDKMEKNGLKINSAEIFENGWLDVEPLFRANGWKVKYDKPGYNEDPYEAFFIFIPK